LVNEVSGGSVGIIDITSPSNPAVTMGVVSTCPLPPVGKKSEMRT
jgi:hypothetical protein